jgi:hypothetical protein
MPELAGHRALGLKMVVEHAAGDRAPGQRQVDPGFVAAASITCARRGPRRNIAAWNFA